MGTRAAASWQQVGSRAGAGIGEEKNERSNATDGAKDCLAQRTSGQMHCTGSGSYCYCISLLLIYPREWNRNELLTDY